jgi:bifunctional non-homologous end joining protein LigD
VAFDEAGRPSFERLQSRMHLASEGAVRRRAREVPVAYVIFDLLYLDGHSAIALPYEDRRELLERLELSGPTWRTPAYHRGDGRALLAASAEQGLEGVVAKRLDSHYEPGRRSSAWIKVKNQRTQHVVIGGFTRGEGGRAPTIGALLVGYHDSPPEGQEREDEAPRLRYAGKVGTGFTDAMLARLTAELGPLQRKTSPFEGRQPQRGAVFVEPRLVADVTFTEWTRSGTLRAPSFKGLRPDVDPREVVREP